MPLIAVLKIPSTNNSYGYPINICQDVKSHL